MATPITAPHPPAPALHPQRGAHGDPGGGAVSGFRQTQGGPHGARSLRNNKAPGTTSWKDSTDMIMGGSKDVVPRMPPEQGQIKYTVGGAYVETQRTVHPFKQHYRTSLVV